MSSLNISLKRVYETPAEADGLRILVERLWPRGVSKANAAIDHWMKDVAPSPQLRTWFGHRNELWEEFGRRYRAELEANTAKVAELRQLCSGKRVTFVFAARDVERNSALLLREFLLSGPTASSP